jgi:hypothetical protein
VRGSRPAIALLAAVLFLASGIAAAAPSLLPLSARLVRQGDLAGFTPERGRMSFKTPELWIAANPSLTAAQRAAELKRLRSHGFVALLSEFLNRRSAPESGVSWVMQLRSAAAARAELTANFQYFKGLDKASGGVFTAYPVPAVPGARAFRVLGHGQVAENVFFADGPFLYLVGAGWRFADTSPPTRAQIVAAVTKLYNRVHGR